jgi:hypothetical protein
MTATFTAIFSDGKIATRSSHREYSHAWRIRYVCRTDSDVGEFARGKECDYVGFASRLDLAESAVRPFLLGNRSAAQAADWSTVRTEIVAVKRAENSRRAGAAS